MASRSTYVQIGPQKDLDFTQRPSPALVDDPNKSYSEAPEPEFFHSRLPTRYSFDATSNIEGFLLNPNRKDAAKEQPYAKDFRFVLVMSGMCLAWLAVRRPSTAIYCQHCGS